MNDPGDPQVAVRRVIDDFTLGEPLAVKPLIQMRLRGSRKVPTEQKAAFVLDRFEEVIDWLDGPSAGFFAFLARR